MQLRKIYTLALDFESASRTMLKIQGAVQNVIIWNFIMFPTWYLIRIRAKLWVSLTSLLCSLDSASGKYYLKESFSNVTGLIPIWLISSDFYALGSGPYQSPKILPQVFVPSFHWMFIDVLPCVSSSFSFLIYDKEDLQGCCFLPRPFTWLVTSQISMSSFFVYCMWKR